MSVSTSVSEFVKRCRFFPRYSFLGVIPELQWTLPGKKKDRLKLGQIAEEKLASCPVFQRTFPGLIRDKRIYSRSISTTKWSGELKASFDFLAHDGSYIVEVKYSDYRIGPRSHYSQRRILQCFCYAGIMRVPVYLVNVKLGEVYRVDYYDNPSVKISTD